MKRTFAFLGALALAGGVAVAAPDKQATASKTAADNKTCSCSKSKTNKQKLETRTGSQTGRTVDLSGRITDGPYQLVVINEETIRRSGASTLSQVLNRQGVRR